MNIFVLDEEPTIAAQMLCDCHLRKMCVETAQILSGVMLRRGMALLDGMPKPQNINHPVIVAAGKSPESTSWVETYNEFLQIEYLYRFGTPHAYDAICVSYAWQLEPTMIAKGRYCHRLAKCCGDLDVANLDIVAAYRKYYTEVKKPQLQAKGLWHFTSRKDWTE